MDLIILLAVFVAFLALAYVTYRNIYNLDSRMRRIEDILKNAQVVAEPVDSSSAGPTASEQAHTHVPEQGDTASVPTSVQRPEPSPYAARYGAGGSDSFDGPIPGWGGEGGVAPKVTVAKEGHDVDGNVRKVEVIPEEDGEGEDGDDEGTDGSDDIDVDDILDDMEQDGEPSSGPAGSASTGVSAAKVADLRKALRDAGIHIPSGAKKADLIQLVEENRLTVNEDGGDTDA